MNTTPVTDDIVDTPVASRCRLLRLAGAAVVGGAAASMLASGTASATTGAMQFGASNNAGASSTALGANVASYGFVVANNSNDASSTAVRATSGGGTALSAYVAAPAASSAAVLAEMGGDSGYPLVVRGGSAHLLLEDGLPTPIYPGQPRQQGEVMMAAGGVFWVCVTSGTPGVWRSLASPYTAGSFYPITPGRAYDSRKPSANPLATGQSRTVSVATKYDVNGSSLGTFVPAGATAIAYNLTVINTVGSNGYLAINEGGNTTVSASIINWSASGLPLANSSLVRLI